ncbi:MAG: NAD(P)-dependent glycerol-3-phosphate dehydrogenase [Clostridia bacterium]|nr:NAD(P)-dependent glycerol-3-phosphate dehydrogenase [Clostridia bacterium]
MAVISVLGAGGWGTALAVTADRNGHSVSLWSPFEAEIESIRRHGQNKKLLPGIAVPASIELTTDLACASQAELVVMAVPSFAIASTAEKLRPLLSPGTVVANAGKGLEEGTYRRFTVVISEALPGTSVVALSGPSHAEEVGRGIPTLVVSASRNLAAAETVQRILMNPEFRIYTTDDVIGVELGGALKNVIALAAGMCDGLNMGDNTRAALMTRGMAEIARLGVHLGAKAGTFAGLSGIGDLIVTCGSMHSRNRRAGILIGQGLSPKEAVERVGTVEGYLVAETAYRLAQQSGIDLPIVEACYRICYEGFSPEQAVRSLMERPGRSEDEEHWL